MADFFLPVLSHFKNGNPWSASAGRLRYRIIPTVEGDETQGQEVTGFLTGEVWEGPWAYEFSTVEESREFSLDQEGLEAILPWLETWRETVESRPRHTLEEDIARKKQPS